MSVGLLGHCRRLERAHHAIYHVRALLESRLLAVETPNHCDSYCNISDSTHNIQGCRPMLLTNEISQAGISEGDNSVSCRPRFEKIEYHVSGGRRR